MNFGRVNAPVQNPYLAVLIPGNVFVTEQKGHVVIHTVHFGASSGENQPEQLGKLASGGKPFPLSDQSDAETDQ